MKPSDDKLAHTLRQRGAVAAHDLAVAERVAERRGEPLSQVLVRMELLDAEQLRDCVVAAQGCPSVELEAHLVDTALASTLGAALCRRHRALPLRPEATGGVQRLALVDPGDLVALDALRQRLGVREVDTCLVDEADLERAWRQVFAAAEDSDVPEGDAIGLLDTLMARARSRRASDIHLEPTRDCARVRFRVDGVLACWRHLDTEVYQTLVGRIKVIAGLDIADSRSPQDGSFSISADGCELDVRVSVLPTDCGEALVLRLLERQRRALDLPALGVPPSQRETLRELMQRPYGLLLVCGPTGSGKSTTLYALVDSVRGEALNTITLEDPVEYPTTWVRQASIHDAVSMDFAQGIRAALRQDPDLMLIGELRDEQTAQMALRAAMTGHRVLSTVHANSAVASIARLWDLGLACNLLAGNLLGVVAQRLLRKLCQHCKCDTGAGFQAVGCAQCEGGYRGRLPVLEVWSVDSDFDELLHRGASRRELQQLAQQKGLQSLRDSADKLRRQGLTSQAEIDRVLGPAEEVR